MSETIKLLPAFPWEESNAVKDDELCAFSVVEKWGHLAVEQATAELRSELSAALARADGLERQRKHTFDSLTAVSQQLQKAEAERDAALAKVARYETLRPASEHDRFTRVIVWKKETYAVGVNRTVPLFTDTRVPDGCMWTHIPTPTEPTL